MKPKYYSLSELIGMIEEPNRSSAQRIVDEHREIFLNAPGSTHNHQAWHGGYWDHVSEVMNYWVLLFEALGSTGRLDQLPPDEKFELADGLLVLFLHDIEKPWRCVLINGQPVVGEDGRMVARPEFKSKADRQAFAARMISEYGFQLTPMQQNALKYVEGIRDKDYTPGSRIMLPLAALCHTCDLLSARAFYDFPLETGDTWSPGRVQNS